MLNELIPDHIFTKLHRQIAPHLQTFLRWWNTDNLKIINQPHCLHLYLMNNPLSFTDIVSLCSRLINHDASNRFLLHYHCHLHFITFCYDYGLKSLIVFGFLRAPFCKVHICFSFICLYPIRYIFVFPKCM